MTLQPPAPTLRRHPELVWPAAVTAEEAVRKVARRLPDGAGAGLTARLYHHPFMGMLFLSGTVPGRSWRRRAPGAAALMPVVVDLVSGRAFLSDPWVEEDFTTRESALRATDARVDDPSSQVQGPAPRLTEGEADAAGRALLAGVLLRRRRLSPTTPAELVAPPVCFGKPNWWVTGRNGDRTVEVVVDALSGRHYVCSG